jgi:DNA-binding Lrp family transcriptional regulator
MNLNSTDRAIINNLQGGFPLSENPWDLMAASLQLSVDELIGRVQWLQQQGYISRFGPMYHAEKMGGALTLAAMKVPEESYEQVSDLVNSHAEVAHNYAREHALNMWFVIATETPEDIDRVINRIEQQTGLRVYNMPKQKEYFLQLKFEV